MTEYEELKQAGLSDHNIRMLRNTGADHRAILAYAFKQHKSTCPQNLARSGAAAVECKHGYDCCPICDQCTCEAK